jgi:hypothetical protein
MLAPGSQLGPLTEPERKALIAQSVVAGVYDKTLDRESAFEKLQAGAGAAAGGGDAGAAKGGAAKPAQEDGGLMGQLGSILFGSTGPRGGHREGMLESAAKSAARSASTQVAREITRGILGSLLGGKRR